MEWLRPWNVTFMKKHCFPRKTPSSFLKTSSSIYHWCPKSTGPWWQSHVYSLAINTQHKSWVPGATHGNGCLISQMASKLAGVRVCPHKMFYSKQNKTKTTSAFLLLLTEFSYLGKIVGTKLTHYKRLLGPGARERIAGQHSCFMGLRRYSKLDHCHDYATLCTRALWTVHSRWVDREIISQ